MEYKTISEVQREDGTKIVYGYNSETLRMRATRIAIENMPDGIKSGYIIRQVEMKNVSPEDISAFARLNKKLGIEVRAA